MQEPTIRVPMFCPACAKERLYSLSVAACAAALLSSRALSVRCSCETRWSASHLEREQIREYLANSGRFDADSGERRRAIDQGLHIAGPSRGQGTRDCARDLRDRGTALAR